MNGAAKRELRLLNRKHKVDLLNEAQVPKQQLPSEISPQEMQISAPMAGGINGSRITPYRRRELGIRV